MSTNIFYTDCNKYLFDTTRALSLQDLPPLLEGSKRPVRLYLPLDLDCEFQTYHPDYHTLMDEHGMGSITITTQLKAIAETRGKIFTHWDMLAVGKRARHTPLQANFAVCDYLTSLGVESSLTVATTRLERAYVRTINRKRSINIVLYAHFAIADFPRIFGPELQPTILEMCRKPVYNNLVKQGRRLRTEYRYKSLIREYIRPSWFLTVDGVDYGVTLTVIDTAGLHGIAGLEALAQNTGTILESKSDLSKSDKSIMLQTYYEKPDEFDRYALGDLAVYQILSNNNEKFREIYTALGIGHRAQIPKLTTGSTIAQLFRENVLEHFTNPIEKHGIEDDDLIDLICTPSSATRLIERGNRTGGLNAKVLGGRCYNPRPLDTRDSGVEADTDISGCYGEGMRNQEYPFGNPVIIDYDKNSTHNNYFSLRKFMARYGSELVPGLWQIWFTVKGELNTPQDFFNSYQPPKKWEDLKHETDLIETESWLELPDYTKIYSHQIENGLLTHDGYQWLMNVCSRDLKRQILDDSIVVTAMFYPKSQRVDTPELLIEKILGQSVKNDCETREVDGVLETHTIDRDCKAWYAVNLGEFLVNNLLLERDKYKPVTKLYKQIRKLRNEGLSDNLIVTQLSNQFESANGLTELSQSQILEDSKTFTKHPLDELFKLCTNTLYGVTISRFFKTSNCLVGNNITGRARALAWYMEKALFTHNSITDGGAFNVNRVAYAKPGKKLNPLNSTLVNRKTIKQLDKCHVRYGTIGNYDLIDWVGESNSLKFVKSGEETVLEGSQAIKKIDELIVQHLQNQFPGIDILWTKTTDIKGNERIGQFGFETKGLVRESAYHGQSNYIFRGGFHDLYKDGPLFVAMRSYRKNENVVLGFLTQLLENPQTITRQTPFEKTQIIKIGDYKQRYNSFYSNHAFIPGDTLHTCGLLRELSLSQFTFRNRVQKQSWEKHVTRLKELYGQSVESYFENSDGSLNYQKMIETVDTAIAQGAENFKVFIDRHRNRAQTEHPAYQDYLCLKSVLANYGIMNPDIESDGDYFDDVDFGEWGESYFSDSDLADESDLADLEFSL